MRKTLRLLVVEDREDDLFLILDELKRSEHDFDHLHVDSREALMDALKRPDDWDLIISDFSLPGMTAHDVLAMVADLRPAVPCIVMSSTISEEAAVDLLRAGARDFVSKERMSRLLPAIDRELRESAERRRQKRNEEALRHARERLQYVVEAVRIGTWESDLRTGQVQWSAVLERLHGLVPGTFGGKLDDFIALIHPDDRASALEQVSNPEPGSLDDRIEYRTVWPDGSQHWLVGIARTFVDDTGKPLRAVGIGMDITAQKDLEEQVRQAQKMESIGNLAGGVAHDFNNLLTVIAGECELAAARAELDAELSASLDAIRTAAVSATALTRQLLTFSRRQVTSPKLLRMDEHVQTFAPILRRLIEENVRLEFSLNAPLVVVRADPGQVEQVLLNLVANARDAMPEGGVVTVATRETRLSVEEGGGLPGGAYLELSVSDTGQGIPAAAQPHLFEPFFTTKPAGRGTGLGLATVHGIVTQSAGMITVSSRPGEGASFRILLPVAEAASETDLGIEESAARSVITDHETILLVEDNLPLRNLAERVLRKAGFRVLTAGSGLQAKQICTEHPEPISLLLADVIMPDGSGPVAAEWICQQRPNTKVIFMSGYTGDSRHIAGKEHVFLQKPFTASRLVELVREVLAS